MPETAEVRLSTEDLQTLRLMLGASVERAAAPSFSIESNQIISTGPDDPFIITYNPPGISRDSRHVSITNSLRDVFGFWDVPKIIVKEEEKTLRAGIFSEIYFPDPSTLLTIHIYEDMWTADNGDVISFDTGMRLNFKEGHSIAFAVDQSILCNVQLAFTEGGIRGLSEPWALRIAIA